MVKNNCKAIKRNGEKCKRPSMKNSDYCYIHSFGRFRKIPFYKNPTFHIIISLLFATIYFLIPLFFGSTKEKQEKIIDNQATSLKIQK